MTDRPLVALATAFAVGILMAAFVPAALVALSALCVILSGLFAFTRRSFWGRCALLPVCALLGFLRYGLAVKVPIGDVSRLAPASITLTGVVRSDVETLSDPTTLQPQTARFTLAAQKVLTADREDQMPTSGSIQVTLQKKSLDPHTLAFSNRREVPFPHYGDIVQIRGRLEVPSGPRNPGAFDERAFLTHQGIHATLTALEPDAWQIVAPQASGNPLLRLAYGLRQAMLHPRGVTLDPTRAGLLDGILLGAREALPPAVKDDFERTGTVHILATAGLHVGIVAALLLWLLNRCRVPRRSALLLTLLGLLLYVVMAGGRPSVSRAAILIAVYLVGILLEREPDLPSALALAALILLLWAPLDLFESGFQLSFATVITILFMMPLVSGSLRRLQESIHESRPAVQVTRRTLRYLLACCFLTIAAQIGSAPLVAYYENDFSLVSILANTLIVPVLAPIIALGFLVIALGATAPGLAAPLIPLLDGLLRYVLSVVEWTSSLPFAAVPVVSPPIGSLFLYYVLLWGLLWRLQVRLRRKERPEIELNHPLR